MTKYYLFATSMVLIFTTSCMNMKDDNIGEQYVTVVKYTDDINYRRAEHQQERTDRHLSHDTLYVFFENGFKSDTIDIKINRTKVKTLFLTTDESLGLANMAHFGNINSIDRIDIIKNRGPALTINLNDKQMYIWTVNFYDSTLEANARKYLQYYY